MARIQTLHHTPGGVTHTYSNYLVILRIYGGAIRLFDSSMNPAKLPHPSYRIFCHDIEKHSDHLQVFVLGKSSTSADRSPFQSQQPLGSELQLNDLAIFMTSPLDSSCKASYAIDIGVRRENNSMEDLGGEDCKKIGTAYVYLEPKFSTQGVQRVRIMSLDNMAPIGQIQVQFLIVTNPLGFGIKISKPICPKNYAQMDAGHRGAGSGCRADLQGRPITENTVASFNYAARHGANACELDVMCTADGVPVVYHNYMLNTSQPIQIDELTLEELRKLAHKSIHDADCKHDVTNYSTQKDTSDQQFPTLEEVLREVDKSCALNIEIKWAQILSNGKYEAEHYHEINDFVERILDCINKHSNGRTIMLSTLNSDIAILLRLKQTRYPVLFLTTGDSSRFSDPVTKTIENAIHFAQAFDMAGVNPNAKMLNEKLVRYAKERGLLVYAWGEIKSAQAVKDLRRYGLDGVIYDKVDLIKPQD